VCSLFPEEVDCAAALAYSIERQIKKEEVFIDGDVVLFGKGSIKFQNKEIKGLSFSANIVLDVVAMFSHK
jgi:hypothetical protein